MEGKQWELETAGQLISAVRKLGEMNAGTQLIVPFQCVFLWLLLLLLLLLLSL